jgi:MmyB-like transcription regulator ligand binding domain
MPPDEHSQHSRSRVADLRAAWARRRNDPDMRELVNGLLKDSPEFGELWMRHEVAVRRMQPKTVLARAGPIALDCEVPATTDGQRLVVLTPPAGTSSMDTLRLLTVVGRQSLERQDDRARRQRIETVPSINALGRNGRDSKPGLVRYSDGAHFLVSFIQKLCGRPGSS